MIFGLAINLEEQTTPAVKFGVQGIILAGTLLVVALLGWPLFRTAFSELRRGRLTIEALFLLTMSGAMFASLQSLMSGNGPIYFEVISILLVVYSLGKLIGARSREAALASARTWGAGLRTCRLADERVVDVGTVNIGDVIEVRAGETIVVDGVIRAGTGFVSEAAVRGEPFVVVKRPGDCVLAGAISLDALLRIEATALGTGRQIDRMLDAVEAARSRPTSVQAQADRLGRLFFPLIVIVALGTFAIWTHQSGWRTGLFNAMSVLLVACPCAFGLATPIVIWSTLNRMAEHGLVVHDGDAIERLAQVEGVVFDKTGTLTDDSFSIVDIVTAAEGDDRVRILGWLWLVESRSQHPIARPFSALSPSFVQSGELRLLTHRTIPGCGIEAELEDRGQVHHVRVGKAGWLPSSEGQEAVVLLGKLQVKEGHRIDVEVDGKLAAIAIVSERLRDSANEAVVALRAMQLPVRVLTGDLDERARALGFADVEGNLLPDDKGRSIERGGGRTLMVGDGINDASALAAAHVGIALSSGTDLANGAASATLYHGDLRTIPWAIALSRQAIRRVHHNLAAAAFFNLIGITLAALGVLHPIVAALLMFVSSLRVAWSSARVDSAVEAEPCHFSSPESGKLTRDYTMIRACVHGLAFVGQAVCAALLLRLDPTTLAVIVVTFIGIGAASSCWWLRSPNIPHWLDMAYGMLSLGNLGMLLGWWADNGFVSLHDGGCCVCVQAMREGLFKPWMWVGMLVGANLAMVFLGRGSHSNSHGCRAVMYTGGNPGMVAGMLIGGLVVARVESGSVAFATLLSFVGMTVGMIAGMLLGAAAVHYVVHFVARIFSNAIQSAGTSNRSNPISVRSRG